MFISPALATAVTVRRCWQLPCIFCGFHSQRQLLGSKDAYVANGIYSFYLPLRRITRKIEQIIREEMERIDGQEVQFPVVLPTSLWQESGRYESVGGELMRFRIATTPRWFWGWHMKKPPSIWYGNMDKAMVNTLLWSIKSRPNSGTKPVLGRGSSGCGSLP